jgi:hypothetical protein
MNSRNAELAARDAARASGAPIPAARRRPLLPPAAARARAALRADPQRMEAVRVSWRALWSSRLLVWAIGAGAAAVFGLGVAHSAYDPPNVTGGFGHFWDVLAAPAARWDSAWYLVIAKFGYRPDLLPFTAPRMAYFPLYPLAMKAISLAGVPLVLAGVLISLCAFGLALYGIHRLTALELHGRLPRVRGGAGEAARIAVVATAFSPMAFYFSAVYTDALYMALSVGVFWSARSGRWVWVGVLGALATATRSTGLMLLVPALVIYLYGPREDRPGEAIRRAAQSSAAGRLRAAAAALRPRHRPRPEMLWLALMPLGIVAYAAWLGIAGGEPFGPFHAEQSWSRHFVGPYLGTWDGIVAGFDGARQLISGQTHHVYFTLAGGDPRIAAWHNLMELAFLALAIPALVGVLRRLPFAYGAYVLAAMALPLSYPVAPQPLMSVPRYLAVLFPFWIWVGAWLGEHPRLRRPALAASIALMGLFVAQFSTWHWVA